MTGDFVENCDAKIK